MYFAIDVMPNPDLSSSLHRSLRLPDRFSSSLIKNAMGGQGISTVEGPLDFGRKEAIYIRQNHRSLREREKQQQRRVSSTGGIDSRLRDGVLGCQVQEGRSDLIE